MAQKSTRRRWLQGVAGFWVLALRHGWHSLLAAPPPTTARRLLVLWMNGGPSQMETFDPKPGAPTGGPTRSIATSVPGLHIAEHLPQVAARMHHLAVLRCIQSPEGEHARAQYLLHTGYRFVPEFPRPSLGSIASWQLKTQQPVNYVVLGGRGFGPAFLGPAHSPLALDDVDQARRLLEQLQRRKHSLQRLQELNQRYRREISADIVAQRDELLGRLEQLIDSPFVEALRWEGEAPGTVERYGSHAFGRACLVARRLLQRGVPAVEVQLDGWDTHQDNFARTAALCQQLDSPLAALLDDLAASGLLQETLVVWLGEFGRTPTINANQGRDHYPQVTPVVLGGLHLGGRVVGSTDRTGTTITTRPHSVSDLFATLCHHLGLKPDQPLQTSFGSTTTLTDRGQVIPELA